MAVEITCDECKTVIDSGDPVHCESCFQDYKTMFEDMENEHEDLKKDYGQLEQEYNKLIKEKEKPYDEETYESSV